MKLDAKWDKPRGFAMAWVRARTQLGTQFAILRAASLCIRGARRKFRQCQGDQAVVVGVEDGEALGAIARDEE